MTTQTPVKVVLIDADGVLINPSQPFSHAHAEAQGIHSRHIEPFFQGDFRQATIGKADLKDLIRRHSDLWHWEGEPETLLAQWFEHESVIDHKLLAVIQRLRHQGTLVYLATDQEKYRAAYIREVMFPGAFDGFFISCDLGFEKRQPEFFQAVLGKLEHDLPNLKPSEVIFFDDSEDKVKSAVAIGIHSELYKDRVQVERLIE